MSRCLQKRVASVLKSSKDNQLFLLRYGRFSTTGRLAHPPSDRSAVRQYQDVHDIGALLVSLGRVLTKKKRFSLLADIRAIVAVPDLPSFDEVRSSIAKNAPAMHAL